MSKCLVTGGAGFIGSNLVNKLINVGHEVIVIDNEFAKKITKPSWNEKAKNYKLDVGDYKNTRKLYDSVDYVFHLAASARVQPSINEPIKTIKNNILSVSTALQCSVESGVKRFIYSSSSSVYGNEPVPNKESNATDCITQYAVSKLFGEELCSVYNKLYNLETISFRYFNVYGNNQPLKGIYAPVIGLFMRQKEQNKSLTIVGSGLQKRDFTNVEDVVDINIIASNVKINKEDFGKVYNVGTGINHSILEIAQTISNEITFIPNRTGEHKETLADTSLTKEKFNWFAKVNVLDWINRNTL
jgi:UDP-glucose 4-epimerase